jgi:hypothetical protein
MRTYLLLGVVLILGCSSDGGNQRAFSDLHPVKGIVMQNGKPVTGGAIQFRPEPDSPGFVINSEVGSDGTFNLTTVRTTDSSGERKTGAPKGNYKVTFVPPVVDQKTANVKAITLIKAITVEAKTNDLKIELTLGR